MDLLNSQKREQLITNLRYWVKNVKTFIGNTDIKFSHKDRSLLLEPPASGDEGGLVLTRTIK